MVIFPSLFYFILETSTRAVFEVDGFRCLFLQFPASAQNTHSTAKKERRSTRMTTHNWNVTSENHTHFFFLFIPQRLPSSNATMHETVKITSFSSSISHIVTDNVTIVINIIFQKWNFWITKKTSRSCSLFHHFHVPSRVTRTLLAAAGWKLPTFATYVCVFYDSTAWV